MEEIKRFKDFGVEDGENLKKELIKIGYNKDHISEIFNRASRGQLGKFLHAEDKELTFGILNAIYKDSMELHRKSEIKKGTIKALVRVIPMALSPILGFVSYIGIAFGSTRAANKILKPILENPSNNYPEFLKKLVSRSMKIFEGEIDSDDPLTMAFVVSDGLVDMVREEVILSFTHYLSNKMAKEDPNKSVPDYYIENELRMYLNGRFKLDPKLPPKRDEDI